MAKAPAELLAERAKRIKDAYELLSLTAFSLNPKNL